MDLYLKSPPSKLNENPELMDRETDITYYYILLPRQSTTGVPEASAL